jgi:hypothetical protein
MNESNYGRAANSYQYNELEEGEITSQPGYGNSQQPYHNQYEMSSPSQNLNRELLETLNMVSQQSETSC